MLRERLVGAALGLPALVALLALNWYLRQHGSTDDLPLLGTVLLIAGASGLEVGHVVRARYPHAGLLNGLYAAIILPLIVHAITITGDGHTVTGSFGLLFDSLVATAAMMLLFLAVWSDVEQRGRDGLRENIIVLLAGIYLGGTLSTLLLLGETPLHEVGVAFVFMMVIALDTAAYFGGKTFGGARLAPRISPSKTVSGAICGLLGAMVLALAFKAMPAIRDTTGQLAWWDLGARVGWLQILLLGAGIGILGQAGDLVESAFKRWGGVKDSGHVIPGHGGFLDRFDSLFLAAPLAYLLLRLF